MKVIAFSNYAIKGESASYKVVSSTRWLQAAAKKAGIDFSMVDGINENIVGDNIIFVPIGTKAFNSEKAKDGLDNFLKRNKNNVKYLMCDDPIHVNDVMHIAADNFKNYIDKEGIGVRSSSIKMMRKGLLDGSIKVLISSMFFKKGLSEGRSKYQDAFNKIDIQHINIGHFQYKGLPNFTPLSNDTAVVASMHDYNRKKVHTFCDNANVRCIEFSKYTTKVDQLTAQKEIAESKYLITVPLVTSLSGTGWFRSAYLSCYKYNTLCVCMDKNDTKLYNVASVDDIINDESTYNEMLNRQQKSFKKIISDYTPTVDFIKNTFK